MKKIKRTHRRDVKNTKVTRRKEAVFHTFPAFPDSAPPHSGSPNYLFFAGKGGVGKTTASAATALYLLDRARGSDRILLISIDPAHSLSDSLAVKMSDLVTEVASRRGARLYAYEMNPSAALDKFRCENKKILSKIAERGTFLDASDVDQILDLSLPGMDEVMALFELSDLEAEEEYRWVVVDTSPSGHTWRLLHLPQVFSHWVRALDTLAEKHRYMVARLTGRRRADDVDLFIRGLGERIERLQFMLRDKTRVAFILVTLPEEMVVEETVRYFDLLRGVRAPAADLIVNRIEREHSDCKYCRSRAVGQRRCLRRIEQEFGTLRLHKAPLLDTQVVGLRSLRTFASIVWENADSMFGSKGAVLKPRRPALRAGSNRVGNPGRFRIKPRRLLIFGGKGGVGKTTAAAAAAIALAEGETAARVLVFSTDPAHSLSDSFGEPVGELKRAVASLPNLDGMEVEPSARFQSLRRNYQAWVDQLFDSLTEDSRWEIKFDREALLEALRLAPPGIDEIVALASIVDLLDRSQYTTIVLDTAPSGHLIRLLELPRIALAWVRTFMKLLLKYKDVVKGSNMAEELLTVASGLKSLISLLTDEERCEFVGVAIPELMSVEETWRLASSLEKLKIPIRRLLINNVVPANVAAGCSFCDSRLRGQERAINALRKRFAPGTRLFLAPQQPREIRGPESLRKHFAGWRRIK